MPSQFISKLQYKTSEKGEYYDEEIRSLDETIELINSFPWAVEQYAHIELTGPSITIKDSANRYLKVGIYYGRRFSLYYLDDKNNFYEWKSIDINQVYDTVRNFFNGRVDVTNFEKQFLGIGKRSFFNTKNFEYHLSWWRVLLLTIYFWIPFFTFLIIAIITLTPGLFIFDLVLGCLPAYIFNKWYKYRMQYLRITRGNDVFYFGNNNEDVRAYNKNDIEKIVRYHQRNSRGVNYIEIFQIVFNDGAMISFSNMLIFGSDLEDKFSDKWKFSGVNVGKNTLRML